MKEVIISLLDRLTASLLDRLTAFLPDRLTASLSIHCKQACREKGIGFVSNASSHQTLKTLRCGPQLLIKTRIRASREQAHTSYIRRIAIPWIGDSRIGARSLGALRFRLTRACRTRDGAGRARGGGQRHAALRPCGHAALIRTKMRSYTRHLGTSGTHAGRVSRLKASPSHDEGET